MSLINIKRPVWKIINQTASFPYTIPDSVQVNEISVCNDGADTVTVEIDTGNEVHTFNCTTNNRGYDAHFDGIKSINVTAGTTYQIELRRV